MDTACTSISHGVTSSWLKKRQSVTRGRASRCSFPAFILDDRHFALRGSSTSFRSTGARRSRHVRAGRRSSAASPGKSSRVTLGRVGVIRRSSRTNTHLEAARVRSHMSLEDAWTAGIGLPASLIIAPALVPSCSRGQKRRLRRAGNAEEPAGIRTSKAGSLLPASVFRGITARATLLRVRTRVYSQGVRASAGLGAARALLSARSSRCRLRKSTAARAAGFVRNRARAASSRRVLGSEPSKLEGHYRRGARPRRRAGPYVPPERDIFGQERGGPAAITSTPTPNHCAATAKEFGLKLEDKRHRRADDNYSCSAILCRRARCAFRES